MPTCRVPVRVSLDGFIEVEAADVNAAHIASYDLKSYQTQGLEVPVGWSWAFWGSCGMPKEIMQALALPEKTP